LLEFSTEPLSNIRHEVFQHLRAHYEELATFKDKITRIEPDWEMFLRLEMTDKLHTVTARDDGKLVGYYVGAIIDHPHYRSVKMASADLYYLVPDYRVGRTGILFVQFIEESLKQRGVQLTVMGTKLSKDLGALYKALGYSETDVVWRKWIGD